MARQVNLDKFATKKDLEKHKKEVHKLLKKNTNAIKKWDIKQDKALIRRKRSSP